MLLTSLSTQDYPLLPHTKVFVADADSSDGTVDVALAMRDWLDVSVIPGGLPSVGRNAGARLAVTPYVLFVDADVVLHDKTLLRRALEKMRRRKLHCLTTNIWCPDGGWRDHLLYGGNNLFQYAGAWVKPFATGMFMLFDKSRFDELGGFNEERALCRRLSAEQTHLSAALRNREWERVHYQSALPQDGSCQNRDAILAHRAEFVQ